MKLLILFPSTQRGGAEEYALTIAEEAVAQGWIVEAAFANVEATQGLIEDFQSANVLYRSLSFIETTICSASTPTELLSRLLRQLKAMVEKTLYLGKVLACLLRSRPDVVMIILPWPNHGFTSLLACKLLRQSTVVVFQLIRDRVEFSSLKLKLYHWIRDRNQTWIANSENNRQLISESFQCPLEKVTRIYNGADLQVTDLSTQERNALRRKMRQALSLPENSKILLTVARLSTQKGYDYLIPTLPHLSEQFPDIQFVWVGDGDQKSVLERQLDEYGVRSSVSMLGYRKDIPQLLQAADLFIFPTNFEGFPFSVLEAMAYGLPVIATAVNGIPEVIEHQVHGLLTRKGDSCDLLEAIRWALVNPDKMLAMAENARLKVREFSQEKMLQETVRVLEESAQSER